MNRSQDAGPIVAIGLMSGTSLDGIDAALLQTDGIQISDVGPSQTFTYGSEFRTRLLVEVNRAGQSGRPVNNDVLIRDFTDLHVSAVRNILRTVSQNSKWANPSIIGFHGHTTLHRPAMGFTQQIGDAKHLADALLLPVVSNFRTADVAAGGQGAPLAPAFHAAIASGLPKPVGIVNIGGISNITWIGEGENALVAFDTGPGNNLLDRWIEEHTGERYDEDGTVAKRGTANRNLVEAALEHPFFKAPWPKSLDRSDFKMEIVDGLTLEDGAATLTEISVRAIAQGIKLCPQPPSSIYVTGGGRQNGFMMARFEQLCGCPVYKIEQLGWDGDSVEAQAFALLAVRSQRGLPITFEGTTGVSQPMTGGTLTLPANT